MRRRAALVGFLVGAALLAHVGDARAATVLSPQADVFDSGAVVTFTVAWEPNDVSGRVVVYLPRTQTPFTACYPAVQPGATASCEITGLPVGTFVWAVEYTFRTCIADLCFNTQSAHRGVVSIVQRPVTQAPTPPQQPTNSGSSSTATIAVAPRLPSSSVFSGDRSVKNTRLTRLVYSTMKSVVRKPRLLAVACWTDDDFASVFDDVKPGGDDGTRVTLAFWLASQPRWLHISGGACRDFQQLLDTGKATGRRAASVEAALHEAMHAYGIGRESQADCYAIQLVPLAAQGLGMTNAQASQLGKLARNYRRAVAPPNYRDPLRCRTGGKWDLGLGIVRL